MRVSSNKLLKICTQPIAHDAVTPLSAQNLPTQTFQLAEVPKGFKRIRYYGVQATKTLAKVKVAIQAALAKVEGVVKGAVKIIARLTYRQRYEQHRSRPLHLSARSMRWGYGASGTHLSWSDL